MKSIFCYKLMFVFRPLPIRYVTVLDSLQLLSAKLTTTQNQQLVWPMLFNALDSSSPQVQASTLS